MTKANFNESGYSRRRFLAAAIAAPFVVTGVSFANSVNGAPVTVSSPNGLIRFRISQGKQISYQVQFKKKPAVEFSKLGIVVDGTDLGQDAAIGRITTYRTRDNFETHD